MRHAFMEEIADALAARKIATARWEFPYMAAGKARTDSPAVAEATVREVWAALDDLPPGLARLPRFAGGKSFGGRMTARAHAGAPLAGALGLIFLGFPLHPPAKPGLERAEHLHRITDPMLFLQGTRDDFAQPALLHPLVAQLPSATLHEISHADHGFARAQKHGGDTIAECANVIASWMEGRIAACGRATRRGTRRS